MKRVAADQSIIDQAIALQDEGKTDAEIARELGVSGGAPNNWRKQGRLPERKKKTNNGKVKKFEDLPELKPGQRLDGTPMLNTEEWKVFKLEETPAAKAPEPAEEPVKVQKPVEEKKARITRSVTLRGEYITVDCGIRGISLDVDVTTDTYLTTQDALLVLMDLETEVHELIAEVEKLL